MRFSTPARRRHRSRPDFEVAGKRFKLRLTAGLVGLAMVGSLGIGSMVSAQAGEPTAEASSVAAAEGTVTTQVAEPITEVASVLAPSGAEAAVTTDKDAASDASADTATQPAAAQDPTGDAEANAVAEVPVAETPGKEAPHKEAPVAEGPGTLPSVEPSSEAIVEDLPAPKTRALAMAALRANPQLPATCGLSMAIVLDLSNSLSNTEVQASKDAAKAVVNSLKGTPSSVGVYTFATFAPDGTNTATAKTSVSTTVGAASVTNKIDQISRVPNSVGGTNWDAALRSIPQAQYDIVLFVTDGNPTAYGTPGTGNNNDYGSTFNSIDLSSAVTAADALKSSGSFVMGLAVGTGINLSNIQAISGTRSGTDYFQIGDYSKLAAQLTEIALKNCQGSVSIVKQVRDLSGALAPASNWTFNSRALDQVTPSSAVTGVGGAVNFKASNLTNVGRALQFTEVQQSGYVLESQSGRNAKCVNNVTGLPVTVNNSGDLGFTVTVNRADAISCEVINAMVPVQVKVIKTWVNAVGGDTASFTANVDAKTGTSTAPVNGEVFTASFAQGTKVTVAEVLGSTNKGSYTTVLKCTDSTGATIATGTQTGSLTGSFDLGANDVTCAFTNTNASATLVVEKKWIVDGKPYDNIKQPDGISAALTLTGATAPKWGTVYSGYFAGNTVTLDETTTIDPTMACKVTDSQVTLANGTATSGKVPYAAVLRAGANTFTVTNTVKCTTTLTLLKFIDDSNGGTLVPSDFTLTATPSTGPALTVAGANTVAVSNTKPVTAGMNYALSESSDNKPAYLQLSLQRYSGTFNPDGSLADSQAWSDAATPLVSVATGHHEVYRFVNASVPTMTLPLTGGTGSSAYLLVGGALLLLALLVTAWILVRRGRANRA